MINQVTEIKNIWSLKDREWKKKKKTSHTLRENILNFLSNKELVLRIHEKLTKLNDKETQQQ